MNWRLNENLSYKFVALGVALILWVSMLGRKDSTTVKEVELQMLLAPGLELATEVPRMVTVEVSGPRVALKKLNQINLVFTKDLTGAKEGRQLVRLGRDELNLPIGARVISVHPAEFMVQIRHSGSAAQE